MKKSSTQGYLHKRRFHRCIEACTRWFNACKKTPANRVKKRAPLNSQTCLAFYVWIFGKKIENDS